MLRPQPKVTVALWALLNAHDFAEGIAQVSVADLSTAAASASIAAHALS
jgi:hypothetical protein